jgi:predicted RNA methylase
VPQGLSKDSRGTDAVATLREGGYPLVVANFRDDRTRVDALAFAPDASGTLLPHTAVLLATNKQIQQSGFDILLERLAKTRQTMGTQVHYVMTANDWYRADSGLRTLLKVDEPEHFHNHHGADQFLVADQAVIRLVLDHAMWTLADRYRGQRDDFMLAVIDVIAMAANNALLRDLGDHLIFDSNALHAVMEDWLPSVLRAPTPSAHATASPVAELMARLCRGRSGVVMDPFCGTGLLLMRAQSHMSASSTAIGWELEPTMAQLAQSGAVLSPGEVDINLGDSFRAQLPAADVVVSNPPFGIKLPEQRLLSNGQGTRQGDLAVLDACLNALKPGGRMVLLTSPAWLRNSMARNYREYLSTAAHIQALIGLPAGSLNGTNLPPVVLVVDKTAPGRTFVADMSAGWEADLAEDGPAWAALQAHLKGTAAHA